MSYKKDLGSVDLQSAEAFDLLQKEIKTFPSADKITCKILLVQDKNQNPQSNSWLQWFNFSLLYPDEVLYESKTATNRPTEVLRFVEQLGLPDTVELLMTIEGPNRTTSSVIELLGVAKDLGQYGYFMHSTTEIAVRGTERCLIPYSVHCSVQNGQIIVVGDYWQKDPTLEPERNTSLGW